MNDDQDPTEFFFMTNFLGDGGREAHFLHNLALNLGLNKKFKIIITKHEISEEIICP